MRAALARDLRDACGPGLIEAITPDTAGPDLDPGQRAVRRDPPWSEWRALLNNCAEALLVAPECGGELLRLTLLARLCGSRQLGCAAGSIHIAGSKVRTAAWLARAGLPVVPTFRAPDVALAPGIWVRKPDDGAGAMGVHRMAIDRHATRGGPLTPLATARSSGSAEAPTPSLAPAVAGCVLQPWVDGPSGSLFVFSDGCASRLLASSTQYVEWPDDQARLVGLGVNESLLPWARAQALATRVAAALPGLQGFWGVDFVLDGPDLRLLEVNPRVTSTYPALRDSLGWNPARLLTGLPVPRTETGPGSPIRLDFG